MEDLAKQALAEHSVPTGDTKDPNATTMHVKVYSPSKVYFDEVATSVSAENTTGPFDILPRHHNFITLLEPCTLEVRQADKMTPQRIKISGGIMHIRDNRVHVFLDV